MNSRDRLNTGGWTMAPVPIVPGNSRERVGVLLLYIPPLLHAHVSAFSPEGWSIWDAISSSCQTTQITRYTVLRACCGIQCNVKCGFMAIRIWIATHIGKVCISQHSLHLPWEWNGIDLSTGHIKMHGILCVLSSCRISSNAYATKPPSLLYPT